MRQEGFISNNGNDISWYRIINDEIIRSIYFHTSHTQLPIILKIAYGYHPLFITPEFLKGPFMLRNLTYPPHEVMLSRFVVLKDANKYSFTQDILVTCPADEYQGLDILEKALHDLNEFHTARECYESHKQWRTQMINRGQYFNLSPQFVDEVIYWDDQPLYSHCKSYVLGRSEELEKIQEKRKLWKGDKIELERLNALKPAILDGRREEYLQLLEERKIQTLRLLKKHTGIQI